MSRLDNILARLPHWWNTNQNSATFGLMKSVSDELDLFNAEKALLQLSIFIDTAVGDELDSLGALFKLPRNADESDASYRSRIKGARTSAIESGTLAGLVLAFTNTTGLDVSNISLTELSQELKVRATMSFTSETLPLIQTAIDGLNNAKAAGVFLITQINLDLQEGILAQDSVVITPGVPTGNFFIIGISVIGGGDALS